MPYSGMSRWGTGILKLPLKAISVYVESLYQSFIASNICNTEFSTGLHHATDSKKSSTNTGVIDLPHTIQTLYWFFIMAVNSSQLSSAWVQ